MRIALHFLAWFYLAVGMTEVALSIFSASLMGVGDPEYCALIILLGYGLLIHSPIAQRVAIFLSLLMLVLPGYFMIWSLRHSDKWLDPRDFDLLGVLGIYMACAAAQLWILTRPSVAGLFETRKV
jgi:hypothetical protein